MHLSTESPRRHVCSDGWNPKLASPQAQMRSFVFQQQLKRPVNSASRMDPCGGSQAPWLLSGRVLKCTGKTEVLPLALQSPEDTPPLCRKDPKVISKTPQGKVFVCVHAQVQGVHIMLKSIP